MAQNKVYAYITHGARLLVFRQPAAPEAGIQVPGGSVEPDEEFEAAIMREAFEETGLPGLTLATYLGEQVYRQSPRWDSVVHHRRFYHLTVSEPPPERWQHVEQTPSIGTVKPLFELFWVPVTDVPPLIAAMDVHVPTLLQNARFATPQAGRESAPE